jgi:DNA invertase Pin-like site-specific DNA recombinase
VRRIAAAYEVSYDAFVKHALGRAGRGARDLEQITETELRRLSAGTGVPVETLRDMNAAVIMARMNERGQDWLLSEDGREALEELRVSLARMLRRREVPVPGNAGVSQIRTDPFTEHRQDDGLRDSLRRARQHVAHCHPFGRLWSRDDASGAVLIGYMRVSKADGSQALDLQHDALVAAGVGPEHLYEDRASGKRDDRPGLEACLKALRKGDVLLAWKLDRLGRDLRHLVNLVHDLTGRGIGLRVLAGQGANLDTTTANGRLVFGIFAALAEFERELIIERTKAGLASARSRGRRGGRPFKMTPAKLRLAQAAMGRPETKVGELCVELGVTRQTLYRHVDPTGQLRPDGQRLLSHKSRPARRRFVLAGVEA